jgi:hypothetical protein
MTISNIRLHVYANQNCVVRKNVIYDRTNSDGTIDRVERVWLCFTHKTSIEGRNWNGWRIEQPIPIDLVGGPQPIWGAEGFYNFDLRGLNTYIPWCEQTVKNKIFNGQWLKASATSYTGEILKQERIGVTPSHSLSQQVTQLTEQITKLTQSNTALTAINQQQNQQVTQIKEDLAKIIQILNSIK